MIDLSQAYNRVNINSLCTELRRTELPEQIVYIIEYMCGNTFVNTVSCGETSELWLVEDGTSSNLI